MKTDSYPRFLKSDIYWKLLQSNPTASLTFTKEDLYSYKTRFNPNRSVFVEPIRKKSLKLGNFHAQSTIDSLHQATNLHSPFQLNRKSEVTTRKSDFTYK